MRISQYTDAELSRIAFPACIEVGSPEKSYSEAAVQVAVWCSAGLRKFQQLHDEFIEDHIAQTPPLVAWTAIGHDWKVHIAYCDPQDGGIVCIRNCSS